MIASIPSATLLGVEGRPVSVEVHVSSGIPGFHVVGLPDAACRESRDRVRAALLSSKLTWPQKRITVNLAPSSIRKGGAGLDLAIAIGLLVAAEELDPEVVEEWKWRGVPVWSHDGPICTGETYKSVVKLTFAKGASLQDPSGLFNASLEGNTRRAIDLREGDELDEDAFKALIRAAVALNGPSSR